MSLELHATRVGKQLARHPYSRARLLTAGVELNGEGGEYTLPFNQLLGIRCKRGIIWGELEFERVDHQVVRLHGTEWRATLAFWHRLDQRWRQWSAQMEPICARVLAALLTQLTGWIRPERWLTAAALTQAQQAIRDAWQALPVPAVRLTEFASCATDYTRCQRWLEEGEAARAAHNQQWLERQMARFQSQWQATIGGPLDSIQARAVVSEETYNYVSGPAGSGKSTVLALRAVHLLRHSEMRPEQLIVVAPTVRAADQLRQRLTAWELTPLPQTGTFSALVQELLQRGGQRKVQASALEEDVSLRQGFILEQWQQLCAARPNYARAWQRELNLPEEEETAPPFWQQHALAEAIAAWLDEVLTALIELNMTRQALLERAAGEARTTVQRWLALVWPLVKAYRAALRTEKARGLTERCALVETLLEKGRLTVPWRHILIDSAQHLPPACWHLLYQLVKHKPHLQVFITAEEARVFWPRQPLRIPTWLAQSDALLNSELLRSWRLPAAYAVSDRATGTTPDPTLSHTFVLPAAGRRYAALLPHLKLTALLDKLSSNAGEETSVLVLVRHAGQTPQALSHAATRWPNLPVMVMPLRESLEQQADIVIVIDELSELPALTPLGLPVITPTGTLRLSTTAQASDEQSAVWLALTRACRQLWWLYDPARPSAAVAVLRQAGIPARRRP